ncbi:hypothetical protein JZ751_027522 [Albula glossodonta]|uniref:ENTH domain-containing protein n=1 Tax=Albula glossodonta TaxID=121402 RepID=A0A8T2NEY2_9TELE|nr:hypothetical protein JZ751_027522 [Albula glossodonta]
MSSGQIDSEALSLSHNTSQAKGFRLGRVLGVGASCLLAHWVLGALFGPTVSVSIPEAQFHAFHLPSPLPHNPSVNSLSAPTRTRDQAVSRNQTSSTPAHHTTAIMMTSSLRRQMKNMVHNYTEAEVKVREATSNDPWCPPTALMSEISDLTFNQTAFPEVMGMIWKRLNDHGKNWRHVYKALTLLEYLIRTGSDHVAQECRDSAITLQTLRDFQYIDRDGKDQGASVREKARQVVALMRDEERLKKERTQALKTRQRTTCSTTRGRSSSGYSDLPPPYPGRRSSQPAMGTQYGGERTRASSSFSWPQVEKQKGHSCHAIQDHVSCSVKLYMAESQLSLELYTAESQLNLELYTAESQLSLELYTAESQFSLELYTAESQLSLELYTAESQFSLELYTAESQLSLELYTAESQLSLELYTAESRPSLELYTAESQLNLELYTAESQLSLELYTAESQFSLELYTAESQLSLELYTAESQLSLELYTAESQLSLELYTAESQLSLELYTAESQLSLELYTAESQLSLELYTAESQLSLELYTSFSSPHHSSSDLEHARPQNSGEEELQLQLALAMSREESEKPPPPPDADEQTQLQIALNLSKQETGQPTPPIPVVMEMDEDTQLQLALSLSKEEHQQEQRSREGDEALLRKALEESRREAQKGGGESAMMDLVDIFGPGPAATPSPWDLTATCAKPDNMVATDPWDSLGDRSITPEIDSSWMGPPAAGGPKKPWSPNPPPPDPWETSRTIRPGLPLLTQSMQVYTAAEQQGPAGIDPFCAVTKEFQAPSESPKLTTPRSGSPTDGDLFGEPMMGEQVNGREEGSPEPLDLSCLREGLADPTPRTCQTPESFLGPAAASLVNLDSLIPSNPPAKTNNPFLTGMSDPSPSNPFQNEQPRLTLNQMRSDSPSPLPSTTSLQVCLPPSLILPPSRHHQDLWTCSPAFPSPYYPSPQFPLLGSQETSRLRTPFCDPPLLIGPIVCSRDRGKIDALEPLCSTELPLSLPAHPSLDHNALGLATHCCSIPTACCATDKTKKMAITLELKRVEGDLEVAEPGGAVTHNFAVHSTDPLKL